MLEKIKKLISTKNPDAEAAMDADKESKISKNSSQPLDDNNGKHDNFDKQLSMTSKVSENVNLITNKNELELQKNKFDDFQRKQEPKNKELLYQTDFERIVKAQNDKNELVKGKKSFEPKQDELKQKYDEQNVILQELKQEKKNFEFHCNELKQQLKEKESQIQSLKQKNDELEDEASTYQSALGIATDFNLSDNVKFNKDILELHDTLENYVTNLKPKIDVDVRKAKELLIEYKCRTKISDKEPNKPLIKAVLQRHVLEEILKQADFYFKKFMQSNKEHHLESHIVSQTTVLIDLMENFYNNRLGDDEITRLVPVRLRQQAFTALGTRGFNNIKKSDSKHDFIYIISKRINRMMNTYRTIKDTEKRKYVNGLAEDLIRNVVRIFYFRLLIQEPIAQYCWFENGEKINKSSMKGSWNEDEIKDMVVEVCSFPLIWKQSHDGFKVFTPAKVFSRRFVKQSLKEKIADTADAAVRKLKTMYSKNDDDLDEEYDSEQTSSTDSDESNYHSPTETVN